MMMTIIKNIRENLLDYGIWVTLKKSFYVIVKPVYKKQTIKIYSVEIEHLNHQHVNNNNFVFKYVDKDDIIIIKQIEDLEPWIQNKVKDMLNSNYICLAALDKNTVAGFYLINLTEISIPTVNYKRNLRANECCDLQYTVNRKFRRLGLATSLRLRMFDDLRKIGKKKCYTIIWDWNIISRKASNKVGFNYIADLSYTKTFLCEGLRLNRDKKTKQWV